MPYLKAKHLKNSSKTHSSLKTLALPSGAFSNKPRTLISTMKRPSVLISRSEIQNISFRKWYKRTLKRGVGQGVSNEGLMKADFQRICSFLVSQ